MDGEGGQERGTGRKLKFWAGLAFESAVPYSSSCGPVKSNSLLIPAVENLGTPGIPSKSLSSDQTPSAPNLMAAATKGMSDGSGFR